MIVHDVMTEPARGKGEVGMLEKAGTHRLKYAGLTAVNVVSYTYGSRLAIAPLAFPCRYRARMTQGPYFCQGEPQ